MIVEIDKRYCRPTEVETLLGDPSKAKEKLEYVFLVAAKVSGILANKISRADFIYGNIMIEAA